MASSPGPSAGTARPAAADRWKSERLEPDLAVTGQRQQIYMPVVFPGFSWYNLNRTAPQNQIPRNRGEFLWRQAYNARTAGARTLKIAMFDEVNESTAMFKLAPRRADAPDQGFWLTLDADGFLLPSDWYLRLAGEITRVFHGQAPPSSALPADPGPPFRGDSAPELAAVNGASFSPGAAAGGAIVAVSGEGLAVAPDAADAPPGLTVIDSSGMDRTPAVLCSSAGQVNVVIPEGTPAGPATLVAERAGGRLAYGRVDVQPVAPGIFSAAGNGRGPAAAVVRVVAPDGTQAAQPVAECPAGAGCRAVPFDLGPEGSVAVLELLRDRDSGTQQPGECDLHDCRRRCACALCRTAGRPRRTGPGERAAAAQPQRQRTGECPVVRGRPDRQSRRGEYRPIV